MRKFISGILLVFLLVCSAIPAFSLADFDYATLETPHIIVIDANDMSASSPIFERASDEQVYPASTTKMLTCLIALENSSLDTEVTVGSEIKGLFETKNGYTENSSLMALVEGETVTMRDLLYGLMLVSGNDAADAIAVAVGGTIENFVSMMNSRAQELGMTNSHFANPNGVHSDSHYSTARDMAKLAAYAMTNAQFAEIVKTPNYTVPSNNVRSEDIYLINSNFLITAESNPKYDSYPYEYSIGIKTGMTPKSGYCLVAAAEKDGAKTIVCLYGDPSDGFSMTRFSNAKKIFENVFETSYVTIEGASMNLQNTFFCHIEQAQPECVNENGELECHVDPSGFSIRTLPAEAESLLNGTTQVVAEPQWIDSLKAPIKQGQQLGVVNYKLGEKTLYTVPLYAPNDVLEVAVIPQTPEATDDSADDSVLSENSLLTIPTAPKEEKHSSGINPIVLILLILIGILVVALAAVLILSSQSKKRKKKLRQQKHSSATAQKARSGGQYSHSGASRNTDGRTSRTHAPSPQSRRSEQDKYYSNRGHR